MNDYRVSGRLVGRDRHENNRIHVMVNANFEDKADFPGILHNANFNPFPSHSYQPLRWLGVTAVGHATAILSS